VVGSLDSVGGPVWDVGVEWCGRGGPFRGSLVRAIWRLTRAEVRYGEGEPPSRLADSSVVGGKVLWRLVTVNVHFWVVSWCDDDRRTCQC